MKIRTIMKKKTHDRGGGNYDAGVLLQVSENDKTLKKKCHTHFYIRTSFISLGFSYKKNAKRIAKMIKSY